MKRTCCLFISIKFSLYSKLFSEITASYDIFNVEDDLYMRIPIK